jgi:hypothetical protein
MIARKVMFAFGGMLLAGISGFAQAKPGTIAGLEFQKPKNGLVKQYEEGRKQKAEWHKQQKDTQPLLVWETLTGDNTGTYIVGRFGLHWADLDKPSVPEQADLDEYNKSIGANVESLIARYYEFLAKDSRPPDPSSGPAKYSEVITYRVAHGKAAEFHSAITRATEAIDKTKWPLHYYWYELANGGPGGTFVLVIPHTNWADFEDDPNVKPFREMLNEAFGPAEAESIAKRFDSCVEGTTSEIIEFRPDLSYLPSK